MAVTTAQLQTALGALATSPTVIAELAPYGAASQFFLVEGRVAYPGKRMIIKTTASDNAATQATTVTGALAGAGNANT